MCISTVAVAMSDHPSEANMKLKEPCGGLRGNTKARDGRFVGVHAIMDNCEDFGRVDLRFVTPSMI